MASLESLYPTIQVGFTEALKGFAGFVGHVATDGSLAERVAKGQKVQWMAAKAGVPGDSVPGADGPRTEAMDVNDDFMTIDMVRNVPITITGDNYKGMQGNIYPLIKSAITDAVRKLVDEADDYMAKKVMEGASRNKFIEWDNIAAFPVLTAAYGLNKIQPAGKAEVVLGSEALLALQSTEHYNNASKFGSDELIRKGRLAEIHGYKIGTKPVFPELKTSTATGYTLDGDHAAGATEIKVTGGTGEFKTGAVIDIILGETEFIAAGVVKEDLSGPGVLKVNAPGLEKDAPSGKPVSIVSNPTAGVAYMPDFVRFIVRPPAVPDGGDSAVDSQMFMDPVSKLVIEVALYKQYRQQTLDVRMAYGGKVVDSATVIRL